MSSFIEYYASAFNTIIRQKRLYILTGIISGLIALLSLISFDFATSISYLFQLTQSQTRSLPLLSLGISVLSFSFIYLQSGSETKSDVYTDLPSSIEQHISSLKHQVDENSKKLKLIEQQSIEGLTNQDKNAIIELIAKKVEISTIQTIFSNEAEKLREELTKNSDIHQIRESSLRIIVRLQREISDLRLRVNINLLIGMTITAGGLYLLWTTVSIIDSSELLKQLASEQSESNIRFIKNLILPMLPRVLLVIFLEVFAYFFLRLYKSGLSDIKYFQNELTNIEAKVLSVEFAHITGNKEHLKKSFEELATTERNFVLEKGQTTIEIEQARLETSTLKAIAKFIPDLIKSNK